MIRCASNILVPFLRFDYFVSVFGSSKTSGSDANELPTGPTAITVIGDSLLQNVDDNTETQLPVPPEEFLSTDMGLKTLSEHSEHEKSLATVSADKVWGKKADSNQIQSVLYIYITSSIRSITILEFPSPI